MALDCIRSDGVQHASAHAGCMSLKQCHAIIIGQRFEFDEYLGQALGQGATESRDKGAFPNVAVERKDHVQMLRRAPQGSQERSEPKGCGGIGSEAIHLIRHQHHPHQQRYQGEQDCQTFNGGTVAASFTQRGLKQRVHSCRLIGGSHGETEHDLDPETHRARMATGELRQFHTQAGPENPEVVPCPVGAQRVRVMEIERFKRTLAQRGKRALPVQAGHFAGAYQGLQRQREQTSHDRVQRAQCPRSRHRTGQMPQGVLRDGGGIDSCAGRSVQRDQLMASPHLPLDA